MTLANAHEVIRNVAIALFSAEERRLATAKEQFIKSNKECYPNKPHDGFTYKGEVFFPTGLMKGARTKVPLHFSLTDQVDDYLADMEKVWTDRHMISQLLVPILVPCESQQDIRDALPNCVVDTLADLKNIKRVREPAFTIVNNDRIYKQYIKALPKIEFYATTRLLY